MDLQDIALRGTDCCCVVLFLFLIQHAEKKSHDIHSSCERILEKKECIITNDYFHSHDIHKLIAMQLIKRMEFLCVYKSLVRQSVQKI